METHLRSVQSRGLMTLWGFCVKLAEQRSLNLRKSWVHTGPFQSEVLEHRAEQATWSWLLRCAGGSPARRQLVGGLRAVLRGTSAACLHPEIAHVGSAGS